MFIGYITITFFRYNNKYFRYHCMFLVNQYFDKYKTAICASMVNIHCHILLLLSVKHDKQDLCQYSQYLQQLTFFDILCVHITIRTNISVYVLHFL